MAFYTPPTPRRVRNRPQSTNAPVSTTRLVDLKIPRPSRVPSFESLHADANVTNANANASPKPERDPFAEDVPERENER